MLFRSNEFYNIPDAVYTSGNNSKIQYCHIFGNLREKIFNMCGRYYFFYRSYNDAKYNINLIKETNDFKQDDQYNINTYFEGGINRYALFIEGKIFWETNEDCKITDEKIETLYSEPTIIISYTANKKNKQDLIVKNDNNFKSLSINKISK